jgi:small subunit ribosomal protein S20
MKPHLHAALSQSVSDRQTHNLGIKIMATHKSAEKRARQTITRNAINRARRSQIQALVKAVDEAVTSNDAEAAQKAQRAAESALARGAGRGTLHWKTAARKASRLAKRVKAVKKK